MSFVVTFSRRRAYSFLIYCSSAAGCYFCLMPIDKGWRRRLAEVYIDNLVLVLETYMFDGIVKGSNDYLDRNVIPTAPPSCGSPFVQAQSPVAISCQMYAGQDVQAIQNTGWGSVLVSFIHSSARPNNRK